MIKTKSYKALEKINETLEELIDVVHETRDIPDVQSLKDSFTLCCAKFKEIREDLTTNIHKIQGMANELKGVVSMSRAALDEGRKFTELLELPRLLSLWSENCHRFNEKVGSIDELITTLKELKYAQVTIESLYAENLKLRKELDERS